MDSPPIPDDLLVDIFLRLLNPADLMRASAACASFRRLVADRYFLRRYCRLHAPPFLGFLDMKGVFHAAVAPHPSASAASAVALAADFTFSSLPAPARRWATQDVRDGRVLLHKDIRNGRVFLDLAVCDPLHRRCLLLPPIPHDLADPVEVALGKKHPCFETFLAPSDDDDEETSFSVVSMVQCLTKLFAFVFSSNTGQWRAISSHSWSDMFPGLTWSAEMASFYFRQYA